MKWIKQHKRAVIFFIGILVITPISINVCLYCNIPTHNTTDGDWLGFWGSFLGSIIGGVATLWGVIITINQIESNEKVLIIPLQSDFDIEFDFDDKYSIKKHYNNYELEQIENDMKSVDRIKKFEARNKVKPLITLVNAGNRNALDVILEWKPYEFRYVKNVIEYSDEIYREWEKVFESETYKTSIPLLRCGDSNNEIHVELDKKIQRCIFLLIHNTEDLDKLLSLPIGVINIISKDISGKVYLDEYKIILDLLCGNKEVGSYFRIKFCR